MGNSQLLLSTGKRLIVQHKMSVVQIRPFIACLAARFRHTKINYLLPGTKAPPRSRDSQTSVDLFKHRRNHVANTHIGRINDRGILNRLKRGSLAHRITFITFGDFAK